MSALTREIVLKSLQGYKVANAIHEKERLIQLQQLSIPESIRVFEGLFKDFRYTEGASGGDASGIDKRRIRESVDLRSKLAEV